MVKRHGMLHEAENTGFDGMMVGHTKENTVGVHGMMNLKTRKIHVLRDIRLSERIWLQHEKRLEREERMEHEDLMKVTDDRT